jgi:hypothetical protein
MEKAIMRKSESKGKQDNQKTMEKVFSNMSAKEIVEKFNSPEEFVQYMQNYESKKEFEFSDDLKTEIYRRMIEELLLKL